MPGTYLVTYTVSDGNGGTATATVNITVSAVNDQPVAVDDSASTTEDTALVIAAATLLGNDSDPDGDARAGLWLCTRQAAALGLGSVLLVESLLVTSLLVLLVSVVMVVWTSGKKGGEGQGEAGTEGGSSAQF